MNTYFYITIGAVLFIAVYYIHSMNVNKRRYLQLEKDKLDLSVKFDLEFTDILDKMVMDTFDEYRLLNLEFDKSYINKDREEEIITTVGGLVSERLSTTFLKQLGLYYNPSVISEVIGKKVYLTVMKYVIENNQTK